MVSIFRVRTTFRNSNGLVELFNNKEIHNFRVLYKVSIISATNASTSITPGERVSFEGEVSGSLVLTIFEGIVGAAFSKSEETDDSRRGVFMKTSVLATREVGLVIIESGLTISVGDLELITSCKPEVARAKDAVGMETGSLVDSS